MQTAIATLTILLVLLLISLTGLASAVGHPERWLPVRVYHRQVLRYQRWQRRRRARRMMRELTAQLNDLAATFVLAFLPAMMNATAAMQGFAAALVEAGLAHPAPDGADQAHAEEPVHRQ